MPLDEATRARISSLIESNPVMLFMKGNRGAPQCGFSATVVAILDDMLPDYATFDVLADPAVREGIKEYSRWPTIPQLYVRGEFVGGCDIVQELQASGELDQKLGVGPPSPPSLRIGDAAAAAFRELAASRDESTLHLRVSPRFENALYFGPPEPGEMEVATNGIVLHVDAGTARRAEGLVIEVEETSEGPAFRIENPNAPAPPTATGAATAARD